jgi:undecaprenyl-diphosphatase
MNFHFRRRDAVVVLLCVAIVVGLGITIHPRFPAAFDVVPLRWLGETLEGPPGEVLVQVYRLSGVGFTAFVVLAALLYVALKRWWNDLRLLAMASGGILLLIDVLLKPLFDRSRPTEKLLAVDGRSFPSGHAAGAVAFYGAVLVVVMAHYPSLRRPVALVLSLWVSLVWLSTLYVRAHWPTDIVAGAAVGLAWLTICVAVWRGPAHQSASQRPE